VSNQADSQSPPRFVRKKLSVIPIASNIAMAEANAAVSAKILARSGLDPHKKTVVFFGLPFPNKQIETLIGAVPALSDGLQVLLVFDDKNEDAYVKEVVQKAKHVRAQGGHVGLSGYLEDKGLSAVLHASDFFVLPQSNPPLTAKSGTAIAASLHGCVVIAAEPAPAGLSQPFVSGKNCVLLPKITPQGLAASLNELAKNPAQCSAISGNAKKLSEYFNWEAIATQYVHIYEDALVPNRRQ
jgi:glycosyltransferase involved in cell wall biosynthesis